MNHLNSDDKAIEYWKQKEQTQELILAQVLGEKESLLAEEVVVYKGLLKAISKRYPPE